MAGGQVWDDVDPGDGKAIGEIVGSIVLAAEKVHRERLVADHAWRLERRAAIIERNRKDAARRERERLADLERKQVERVLRDAEALRQAKAIRTCVSEVRSASPPVPTDELNSWANWALERADRIDPVLNAAFLATNAEERPD